MPKQKTHTGAKKRFKLKKSGLIKRNKIYPVAFGEYISCWK